MANLLHNIKYGEIILPDNIHVATGRDFNLWWSTAAVYEEGDRSVYFEVKCDVGLTHQRGYRLRATKEMIGEHSFTVRSRSLHTREIISEKTLTLHVVDAENGTGDKNILMIGDSRSWHTVNGVQGKSNSESGNKTTTTELKTLLDTFKGATFTFLGDFVSEADPEVKNLALSGWCYSTAVDWITEAGGFAKYLSDKCGLGENPQVDYVTIMYGINDLADWHQNNLDQYERSIEKYDSIVNSAKQLISLILKDCPQAKIVLVLESSTAANQDGFGYWGASDNDCQVEWEFAVKALRKRIIEEFDNGTFSESVILSAAGLWCDRLYSYPFQMRPASARAENADVLVLTNCVHPHDSGYKQIADGDFSTIKYLEQ